MEQGLSFIGVCLLCILMLYYESPIGFGISYVIGCGYLLLRGKKKGWIWKRD